MSHVVITNYRSKPGRWADGAAHPQAHHCCLAERGRLPFVGR